MTVEEVVRIPYVKNYAIYRSGFLIMRHLLRFNQVWKGGYFWV